MQSKKSLGKRILSLVLTLLLVVGLIPISALTTSAYSTDGYLHLDRYELIMCPQQTETLVPSVQEPYECRFGFTWTSSDPSVATVDDNGNVTAVALGEATITAKGESTDQWAYGMFFYASCDVTVVDGPKATIDNGKTVCLADKDGDGFYEIGTADQLYAYAAILRNGETEINGELTTDITVNERVLDADRELVENENYRLWTPIHFGDTTDFSGVFDGHGYKIRGLYSYYKGRVYNGFVKVNCGVIKNLSITDSYFYTDNDGPACVGAICGTNRGEINNCYSTSTVSSNGYYVGGICGQHTSGLIIDSCNNGKVSGTYTYSEYGHVAGIAGACLNTGTTIRGCYNLEEISGDGRNVGGICGELHGGIIEDCYNIGEISSNDYYVGGICGQIYGYDSNHISIVRNCYNTGAVSTTQYNAGGISGCIAHEHALIEKCYNTGSVTAVRIAGGIAGRNSGTSYSYGTIQNCYNSGSIHCSSTGEAGGIVESNYGTLKNCYNIGKVTCKKDIPGAICRGTSQDSILENNYYLVSEDNLVIATGVEAKTEEQFGSGEVAYLLQGEQENDVWGQKIGVNKYPVIEGDKVYKVENCIGETVYNNKNENVDHTWIDATCTTLKTCSLCGVTEGEFVHEYGANGFCVSCDSCQPAPNNNNVYEISNAGHLYWFADKVNNDNENFALANAKLIDNVVVNEGVMNEKTNGAREWTPIGSESNPYKGVFNGNDKTISGLFFDNAEVSNVGLFGYLNAGNSSVKNLGVINSYFNGKNYVGAIAGYNSNSFSNSNDCPIEYCYSKSIVKGENYVGGIVGRSYEAKTTNCYNAGTVIGNNYIGGIVGYSNNRTTSCDNFGDVAGANNVGGIAGYMSMDSLYLCNNKGSVTGETNVGGVIGRNQAWPACCYNEGEVRGVSQVGGVCGFTETSSVTTIMIRNTYNTGTVIGEDYVGGVVGKAYSEVSCSYNVGEVIGKGSNVSSVVGYDSNDIVDCYYLSDTETDTHSGTTAKSLEQFKSGEVAYLLQSKASSNTWGQKIGTDTYPVIEGDKVYYGYDSCAIDSVKVYTNEIVNNKRPAHDFADEVCTACSYVCEHGTYENGNCAICGKTCDHNWGNGVCTICSLACSHEWEDGICTICDLHCKHGTYENGDCAICGKTCSHEWEDGICTICDLHCKHGTYENGVCTICGKTCDHNWENGVCTICDLDCEHSWEDGICTICDLHCKHGTYENGVCTICGKTCDHNWVDGICTICDLACSHEWEDGVCTICDLHCEHEWYYGSCEICSKSCNHPQAEAEYEWYFYADGTAYANIELTCTTCNYYADSYGETLEPKVVSEPVDCQHPGENSFTITYEYNGEIFTDTKTVEVKSDNHVGEIENGFCSLCGGYEPATFDEENYVYEIENAGQLYWFAENAVALDNYASAVLTADIVVNDDMNAESLREWTAMGESSSMPYCGTFDGQGHSISGLYAKSEQSYVGLFGAIGWGATIKNLGIVNSYFEGDEYVGGIVGYNDYSYVTNCYAEDVEVVSNDDGGALVGYNYGEISNSYTTSDSVAGDNSYGTITNCYYLADEETDSDDGTTAMSVDAFLSGEVAYLLQSGVVGEEIYDEELGEWVTAEPAQIWGQKIGTDNSPVLYGDKVYKFTDCRNNVSYSNEFKEDGHNIVNGKCTVCFMSCPHGFDEETGLCPTCGADIVAKADGKYYTNIDQAISTAAIWNADVKVEVLKDVTIDYSLCFQLYFPDVKHSYSLDLGGHTISFSTDGILVSDDVDVTITNGTITSTDPTTLLIYLGSGKLTLGENLTVTMCSSDGLVNSDATLVIDGADIVSHNCSQCAKRPILSVFGKLEVKSGSINGSVNLSSPNKNDISNISGEEFKFYANSMLLSNLILPAGWEVFDAQGNVILDKDAVINGEHVAKAVTEFADKVENVTISDETLDSFTVSFDKVAGATKYWIYLNGVVYYSTTETSFTVTNRKAGTDFEVMVTAGFVNKNVTPLRKADVVTATTLKNDYDINCTSSLDSISLSWGEENATKTWIYVGTDPQSLKLCASTTGNSYEIKNRKQNTDYFVKITHLIDGVVVDGSDVINIKTQADKLYDVDYTVEDNKLTVSYNELEGAYKYWVIVNTDGVERTYATTDTIFTVTKFNEGSTVTVRAACKLDDGSVKVVEYYKFTVDVA